MTSDVKNLMRQACISREIDANAEKGVDFPSVFVCLFVNLHFSPQIPFFYIKRTITEATCERTFTLLNAC